MKVKFDKIPCEMIDGSVVECDLTKSIAEYIFKNAVNIEMHELALKMNKYEEIELTKEIVESLPVIVEQTPNMVMFAKIGFKKWFTDVTDRYNTQKQ